MPAADATAVARLRGAGAIVLGKTNTPEFTLGFETVNPVYGRGRTIPTTGRARRADRAAARRRSSRRAAFRSRSAPTRAAASGCRRTSAASPGSDRRRGGCRAPGTRSVPGPRIDALTTIGPLARHVEDLALALSLLAGPDDGDPFLAPVPLGDPAAVSIDGLRVAVFTDNGIAGADAAVADAVHAAAAALAAVGRARRRRSVRPAVAADRAALHDGLHCSTVAPASAACWRAPVRASATARWPGSRGLPALAAAERVRVIAAWDRFRSDLLAETRDFDLLVCPPNAHPALRHGEVDAAMRAFSHTMTWNLAGWPGAVVRVGTSPEGLPIGVQLVARPWREDVALAAAACIERASGGWRPLRRSPMSLAKRIGLWVLGVFYLFAGVMHFWRPEFYIQLMPPVLPAHRELVELSGVAEFALGLRCWRSACACRGSGAGLLGHRRAARRRVPGQHPRGVERHRRSRDLVLGAASVPGGLHLVGVDLHPPDPSD